MKLNDMLNEGIEEEIMWQLRRHPDRWFRCMDLGGTDASRHSRILAKLCKQGKIEWRRRCVGISAALGSKRGGKEYRLAPATQDKEGGDGR